MNFLKDISIDKIQNMAEDVYNSAKPKTDVEARVFEVLSHKNWGASGSLMNEIARDTYDLERFQVVSSLMWDGMENQRPAAWKVVFKSLNLLEHLVKNGAERCVDDARNHSHVLRSLGQFNYYEGTIDRGLGVREKSKQVLEMLSDDDRIREERAKARKLREKFGNFNKGSSGIGGGGSGGGNSSGSGGYGNQDSWNSGGSSGYGEGGIHDNDKAYSGRYGNSSSATSSATPTFAAIPGEKKKSKKKKKKQQTEPKQQPAAAAPAPARPVADLLGFDAPAPSPAPAVATGVSADFGAFQGSSGPASAGASDDFAEFDQLQSKKSQGPDPFASPPAPQQAASFDAFGNNNASSANNNMMRNNMMSNNMANNNMLNNNMMGNNMMGNNMIGNNMMGNNMMNNKMMNNNMAAMGNAFNNMSVGTSAPAGGMQQPAMPASNDDDFGDFEAAKSTPAASVAKRVSSDPMASLINLDGLSKNPSNKMTMNQPVVPDAAAQQYQQDMQNGVQGQPQGPFVVSAGGSDAISSMMGPPPPQQQMGSNFNMNSQGNAGSSGMPTNPQMQQQQFNMNSGMQGGGMNNMMGGNTQMQGGMMYGNQMGGMQGGSMNTTNMNMNQMGMNQMGGQQQQMNKNPYMQGGMNQMGGMQGGMNQMGGQMMGNMGMQGGMGGQQSFR